MLLEMKNITKEFPGVKALDDVSLELKEGEILALVGENGAGKSTVIKILSGAYTQDLGEVYLNGVKQEHVTPITAIKNGISVIYQELNNVDQITVAENIFLGNLPRKGALKILDYDKLRKDAQSLLDEVGLKVDPFTPLEQLSIAQKQLVEIAKALSKEIKILVMDEPTAALNNQEIEIMFRLIRNLTSRGIGILYISHRMEEIFQMSDRVMVMRDGKGIATMPTTEVDSQQIISLMVGREIKDLYPQKCKPGSKICFSVEGLETERLHNISFEVKEGEILGLFGLMGCGRTDIARAIFGADPRKSGKMCLDGKDIAPTSPFLAKKEGIAYIPADRKMDGLMLIHSVSRNMTISVLEKLKRSHILNKKVEMQLVDGWIDRLAIKTPSADTIINSLSGGNQQKVVLAKWLSIEPKLLILNEPTRGIDVGSKSEIYRLMNELCQQGIGIIMISSDLPEVMGMSDRMVIVCDGKVGGIMEKEEFTQDAIMAKAIGL